MKRLCRAAMLLLLLSTPLYGQSEAQLKAFIEGKKVVVKIDMPATSEGIDIHPEKQPDMDHDKRFKDLRRFGTAVREGDSILVTKVKVKDDLIEFHLGGGGMGARIFQDSWPSRTPKSERELILERQLAQEQDYRRSREISLELESLRKERELRDQKEQERRAEENQKKRLGNGSRFNIRYKKNVPPEALTPEGLMRALANYVEFPRETIAERVRPSVDTSGNVGRRPRPLETSKPEAAVSEPRLALVIGNSDYKDAPLTNPVNDARDIARALRGFGFEVTHLENQSQTEMKRAIRSFGEKLRQGGAGLFYYAGHGVQVKGQNYMIPVGAVIDKEEEVEYEGVDVGRVLEQMGSAGNRLNIIVLDACRNNPFASKYRSVTRGLAVVTAPSGTLIAYATQPENVASDGDGRNGLYTQELLDKMQTPGLSIEEVFKGVRIEVMRRTQNKQVPWESSSLVGSFYFKPPPK